MDCSGFQDSIYQGVLTRDVERHIADCAACANLSKKLSLFHVNLQYQVQGSAGYHEYRKQLILQKVDSVETSAPDWTARMLRVAYIFVVIGILFFAFPKLRNSPQRYSPARASIDTIAFEVGKVDQSIQLRWKGDPRKMYRIYKGPTPKQLQPIGEFHGLQWIDASRSSASLVFYKIEAL